MGGFVPWEREALKRIAQLSPLKDSKAVSQNETGVCKEGWGRRLPSENSPKLLNTLHRPVYEEIFSNLSTKLSRIVIFMAGYLY